MMIKNVIPLTIRKKEHDLWYQSNYESKAIIGANSNDFKATLKVFVESLLKQTKTAACIAWSIDTEGIDKLINLFSNDLIHQTFPPKGNFLVMPGAIVAWIVVPDYLNKIIDLWGELDKIQIIFPITGNKSEIDRIVCSNSYIYERQNFKTIDEVMKYSKIVINDTGDGEECEIIFHNGDSVEISDLLKVFNYPYIP